MTIYRPGIALPNGAIPNGKKGNAVLVRFETYSSPWFERDTLDFAPSMEKLITYPNPSPHLSHSLKIAKSRAKYGIEGKCATILQ